LLGAGVLGATGFGLGICDFLANDLFAKTPEGIGLTALDDSEDFDLMMPEPFSMCIFE